MRASVMERPRLVFALQLMLLLRRRRCLPVAQMSGLQGHHAAFEVRRMIKAS